MCLRYAVSLRVECVECYTATEGCVCVLCWKTADLTCLNGLNAALYEWHSETWIRRKRFEMLKKMALMGMGVLLASCATTEFREEKGICSATWTKKIPPRYEQEMYNAMQSRQVPTGQVSCTTSGYGYSSYTNCTQLMRTEFYTVPSVRTVDRNATRRNAEINSCTQNMCLKKFGNVECKA